MTGCQFFFFSEDGRDKSEGKGSFFVNGILCEERAAAAKF